MLRSPKYFPPLCIKMPFASLLKLIGSYDADAVMAGVDWLTRRSDGGRWRLMSQAQSPTPGNHCPVTISFLSVFRCLYNVMTVIWGGGGTICAFRVTGTRWNRFLSYLGLKPLVRFAVHCLLCSLHPQERCTCLGSIHFVTIQTFFPLQSNKCWC